MADPTAAEAQTTWLDYVEWLHDGVLAAATQFTTDAQSVLANLTGDQMGEIIPYLVRSRSKMVDSLRDAAQGYVRTFRAYCRALDPRIDFDRLGYHESTKLFREYLDDVGPYAGGSVDSKVTSRDWTRGSEASPTSTQIFRLLVDERGQAIEEGFEQKHEITVSSSAGDDPAVRIEGEPSGADAWQQEHLQRGLPSPIILPLISDLNAGGSRATNHVWRGVTPTTDAADVTAAPTGWTMGSVANWDVESTAASQYRSLTQCLRNTSATSNHDIYQVLTQRLDPRVPYLPAFLADNDSSWIGTMTLTWGSKTQTFTNSAVTSGWKWHAADRDVDLWPLAFVNDGATIGLAQTAYTSGTGKWAALGLFPGVKRYGDGGWYWGFCQDPDPLFGARAGITDTIGASEGKIQQVHNFVGWLLYGRGSYLNTTGTTTISDP